MELIDTHAHLDFDYGSDITVEDIVHEAGENSVSKIITITSSPESLSTAKMISDEFANVYYSLGIHPHDAKDFTKETEGTITGLKSNKCVAVGEIGLDYHYEQSPREIQRKVFEKQIEMARLFSLPIVIHTREADRDTMEILDYMYHNDNCIGVVHCYSGSVDALRRYLDKGLHVSFTGIITFPKADNVREAAKYAPDDRIMVETDCPFLAPVPHRGKNNFPSYLRLIAEKLAEIRGTHINSIAEKTTNNARSLFGL